ncbi:MAG: hypothetical protein LBD13_05385 [Spirochaetaceae bacterium]|nr:hypothetical protein [Spirochaetaceae bacterium]
METTKTIICICGPAHKGKTKTICELARLLVAIPGSSATQGAHLLNSPNSISINSNEDLDEPVIVTINGKTCGIISMGDVGTDVDGGLQELVKLPCDVIICASRTKGATVWAVHSIAERYSYELIWTSPYVKNNVHTNQPSPFSRLNELKAAHLKNLLALLGLFP